MTIIQNRRNLIDLLQSCEDLTSDAQTCIESTGLLKAIRSMFIPYTVQKVLLILQPADKLLQSRECDIHTGLRLISTIIQTLKELREKADETFSCVKSAELAEEITEDEVTALEPNQPNRRRKLPAALSNSVMLSSVGVTVWLF